MYPAIYLAALAVTAFVQLALITAAIFAVLRWRGVATVYALPSSLIFAQKIRFFMSWTPFYFTQAVEWAVYLCFALLALIPVCLAVWLLWSRRAASASLIALIEIGELVESGFVVVNALQRPYSAPPVLTATAVATVWRLTILIAVIRIAAGRGPDPAPTIAGIFD